MSDILSRIISRIREDEQASFNAFIPYDVTQRKPGALEAVLNSPGSFLVISECKKASPSKGVIVENYDPAEIAMQYKAGGASAISVLTEKNFFQGDKAHLPLVAQKTGLPVLRKDFIFHPAQVYEARALGADLVLLIVAALEEKLYLELHDLILKLGMVPLVEVHDEAELQVALKAPLQLLGVNNRSLKTFEVDLNTCLRIKKLAPAGLAVIAESGISSYDEVKVLKQNGFKGILAGESLLRQADRTAALKRLLGEAI